MKRRDFLKTSVVAGAALSLNFEGLQAALSSNTVAVEQVPDLVAVMGGEPEVMLDKALEALGGIGKYIKKGQKVVIKPNIGWDRTPELAGNTNPGLVKALVKKCFEAGAEKVTVFDHTCDNWQKCYETSGIAAAVKEAGGIIMPGNDEKYFKEVAIPNGVTLKKAKIHESLIEADVWINVPILKNHGGAKLSCAMKNMMGIVWDRRFFHQNDLQQWHRRHLYLAEEAGAAHRGCLPHDAPKRPARKKCGRRSNVEINDRFPEYRSCRYCCSCIVQSGKKVGYGSCLTPGQRGSS